MNKIMIIACLMVMGLVLMGCVPKDRMNEACNNCLHYHKSQYYVSQDLNESKMKDSKWIWFGYYFVECDNGQIISLHKDAIIKDKWGTPEKYEWDEDCYDPIN